MSTRRRHGPGSRLHAVGDGAPWIANQVKARFGTQGTYLVDFFHTCEYPGAAAPACAANDAEAWLETQKDRLKANRADAVLEALADCLEAGYEGPVADCDLPGAVPQRLCDRPGAGRRQRSRGRRGRAQPLEDRERKQQHPENQGLPLHAHNGHGQQHLSSLLASLILLAFLTHTVLEWVDDKFQLLRQKLPSRRCLFDDIKTLTSYLCFDSWEALIDFMLESFNRPPPEPKTG